MKRTILGLIMLAVLLTSVLPAGAAGPRGSRDNPIPLGQSARLPDGWVVKVTSPNPNAWRLIQAENQFNDPPKAGRTFFMVRLVGTYRGSKARDILFESDFEAVGRSSVAYQTFDDSCGVIPNELPSKKVFQGGTVAGNACWSVKKSDVGSLLMYWEDFITEKAIFWRLRR